jgi:uncharacterized membrane protein SpoIIM required for sporulation
MANLPLFELDGFFEIPATILAGMIALPLAAWQCVRRRNQ